MNLTMFYILVKVILGIFFLVSLLKSLEIVYVFLFQHPLIDSTIEEESVV